MSSARPCSKQQHTFTQDFVLSPFSLPNFFESLSLSRELTDCVPWLASKPWRSSCVRLLSADLIGAKCTLLGTVESLTRVLALSQQALLQSSRSATLSLVQTPLKIHGTDHFCLLIFHLGIVFGEACDQVFYLFLKLACLFLVKY